MTSQRTSPGSKDRASHKGISVEVVMLVVAVASIALPAFILAGQLARGEITIEPAQVMNMLNGVLFGLLLGRFR